MEDISLNLKKYISENNKLENLNEFFIKEFENNANNILPIILQDLRSSQSDLKFIFDTFKTEKNAIDWYYSDNGYLKKYTDYFYGLMAKFRKPADMVKYLPTIAPWTYARSFETTEMGRIPESFKNKENLLKLIGKIMNSKSLKKLRTIKDYDHDLNKFHKDYPEYKKSNFNCFFEKSRILKEIISKNIEKEISFKFDHNQYIVEPMCNPFTNKIVFKIRSLADNILFILKISPNNIQTIKTDHDAKTKENQMLRGDSPYLNAMVDFYLKLNQCENAANIVYYNYEHDFVVYEADEGAETSFDDQTSYNLHKFNREKLSDTNKLGIYMNDVNNGNFFNTDDGRLIIIDSGHVSYSNLANPGVLGCTTNLSNLCGRSLISGFGSFLLDNK